MATRAATRTTRSVVMTFVMAAGVLTYLVLVFLPAQKSIGELRSELREQRAYILDQDRRYAELLELQTRLDRVRGFVEAAARDARELTDFLSALTRYTEQSGVTLQRITPREVTDKSALTEQVVELVVEGGFQELFAFLRQIESWPGNAWTTKLDIEPSGEAGETLTCRMSLTIFTNLPGSSD